MEKSSYKWKKQLSTLLVWNTVRASDDTKETDEVVEWACLLMALEDHEQATAAVLSAEASEVR